MAPVGRDGQPPAANRFSGGPQDSGRMVPAGRDGRPGDRFDPAAANGFAGGPRDAVGRDGYPAGPHGLPGRGGPQDSGRMAPAGRNGFPVDTGHRVEPAGRNGFPVDSGDRHDPPGRNGYSAADRRPANGHPSFPPRRGDDHDGAAPRGRGVPGRDEPALESTGRHGAPPRRGRRRAEDIEQTGRHGHAGPADSGWRIERPSLSQLEPVRLGQEPPAPLSGRLHPADPIIRVRREDLDVTGQLPPLDLDLPSARPGPADSYGQLTPVRRPTGRRYR